jgi:hypothetical protein
VLDEIKLLSAPKNYAVVHLPRQKLSGVVLEGNSLRIIIDELDEARAESDAHQREGMLSVVIEAFQQILEHYEAVLHQEGVPLPYRRR